MERSPGRKSTGLVHRANCVPLQVQRCLHRAWLVRSLPRPALAAASLLFSLAAVHPASGGEGILAPRSYDVEAFDVDAVAEAAEAGAAAEISYFGRAHTLILEPAPTRSLRFEETAGYSGLLRTVYSNPARTLKGRVADEPGSIVRLAVSRRGLRGYIKSSEGWVFFEPLARDAALGGAGFGQRVAHKVFTEGDIAQELLGTCEAPPDPVDAAAFPGEESAADAGTTPGPGELEPHAAATLRVLELAVEADAEFHAAHGERSKAEIEAVINLVNGIYEAELGITIEIVYFNVWESEPDPYSSTDPTALLAQLRSYWAQKHASEQRDGVLLFTGKDLDGLTKGVAYVAGVCLKAYAFALSEDLSSDVFMPILVAHEVGHILGATHDPARGLPWFIMHPFLSFRTIDEFSARSNEQIARHLGEVTCIQTQPTRPDDPGPAGPGKKGTEHPHRKGGGGGPVDPMTAIVAAGALVARRLLRNRTEGKKK